MNSLSLRHINKADGIAKRKATMEMNKQKKPKVVVTPPFAVAALINAAHRAQVLGIPHYASRTTRDRISGIRSAILRKLSKLRTMVGRMDKLNAHHAYCLIRRSLPIPKLSYLLRTTPCWQALDVLEEYDSTLKATMQTIVNCRFSGNSWDEATLPVKLGGLGLRSSTNLCYSSFLGSIHSVSNLVANIVPAFTLSSYVYVSEASKAWSKIAQSDVLPEPDRKLQHKWDLELCSQQHSRLLENCTNDSSKARMLANKSKESGAWLNAFPFSTLGTLLDNQSFRIVISLRLGIPVCVAHTCIC